MQEKLTYIVTRIRNNKKKSLTAVLGFLALIGIGIATINIFAKQTTSIQTMDNIQMSDAGGSNIEIATVGDGAGNRATSTENSWPGEIISLDNLEVQPAREGTIAGWYVHIGENVRQGQTIGTLSQPPATPELMTTLASQREELSNMRAHVDTQHTYIMARIETLKHFRESVVASAQAANALLGVTTGSTADLSIVSVKQKDIRAVLQGVLVKTYPLISANGGALPTASSPPQLKSMIGVRNSGLREVFSEALLAVMSDLNDPNKLPTASGLTYFDTAIKLANASIPDGNTLLDSDLEKLKTELTLGQSAFIAAINDMKTTELDTVTKQKEVTEQLKNIELEIAGLEKDHAVQDAELASKEVAYSTVSSAIKGGYTITAPRSGVISSVLKKPGEFVGPGMPVAVITGGGNAQQLVRIRIPSNIRKPMVGETLSVFRPGFPTDARTARLLGVGSSLDETGSYMADAVFSQPSDWPVSASVRVIALETPSTITIKLSSILWGGNGEPYVWAVSDAGRVFAKKLTLGRTLGAQIEVYVGLRNGDRYIVTPTPDMKEDMLVDDISAPKATPKTGASYEEMMRAMGM